MVESLGTTVKHMQMGLLGVGKMGAGIMRRLQAAGHQVVAYDHDATVEAVVRAAGARWETALPPLVQALTTPRVVWLMVPAGEPVANAVHDLREHLSHGDTVIDGGNSRYTDSLVHVDILSERGIQLVDVGVSGGLAGERDGYALMVGGSSDAVRAVWPLLEALAAPEALSHVGPAGAGHFVKMVHNAVEYGMMQSIGEGFALLKGGPFEHLDLARIAALWSRGTIVRSHLMELTARALAKDGKLTNVAAYVEDKGEGRWAVETAVQHAVPLWANTAALYTRFASRDPHSFAAKLVAALRREFGGHDVRKSREPRSKN